MQRGHLARVRQARGSRQQPPAIGGLDDITVMGQAIEQLGGRRRINKFAPTLLIFSLR
jgi:hypothetical protein